MMANAFGKGDKVTWHWGSGTAEGKIEEKFDRRVQRTLKGAKVVKNGTKENPAYLVVQENDAKALKRGSELEKG